MLMCNKWDREWERCDDMGIYTMEECCEKADEVDEEHVYESVDNDTSDDEDDDLCYAESDD